MKFTIKHEIEGRLRIHIIQKKKMTDREADALMVYFSRMPDVKTVRVYERTSDMVLEYEDDRDCMIRKLKKTDPVKLAETVEVPENSVRSINRRFTERLTSRIMMRAINRLFLPAPVSEAVAVVGSVKYFYQAVAGLLDQKADTRLLDAASLAAAFIRADYEGAGSVVFLLDLGHILEHWLEKQKIESLSETMQLNIDYAWLKQEDGEVRIPMEKVNADDLLIVHEGEMVPFDGIVIDGAGSVIQTSLTGNALPQPKTAGAEVFAGTRLDEGTVTIRVVHPEKLSRYDKIVSLVDNMQNLKPEFETCAYEAADKKVPWLLGGSGLTWLITRNTDQAFSFVTVDFSAALKLAIPRTVLQARKAALRNHIIVKGGRFMENMAAADTIIFDKTGTLTKAQPVLKHVYALGEYSEEQLLRLAACMEEHVGGPVAEAIVKAGKARGLAHEEIHGKVERVLAHGATTYIGEKRAVIGTYHFVFEDEACPAPQEVMDRLFDAEHVKEHHIFLTVGGKLEGVFIVEDELKDEAAEVIRELRGEGFAHVYMLTGDAELSAKEAAGDAGVDQYYAEKLPEEKAEFIQELQRNGHKVVMVGDGVNDSLALSVADVGICLGDGANVSKKLADVIIRDVDALAGLRRISIHMMEQMKTKYNVLKWTNGCLVALGATGVLLPQNMMLASHAAALAVTLWDDEEGGEKQ